MNRVLVSDVDPTIADSTVSMLLPVLGQQLDKGGCRCFVVHVKMTRRGVGQVDAACGHTADGCPMDSVGSVDEPTVVMPPGGAN